MLLCAIQRILYWTSITNVLDLFFYRPDNIQRIGGTKKEVVLLFCFFVCLCHAFLLCDYMMDAVHALSFEALYTYRPTYTAQYRSFFFFASNTMQEMLRNTHKVRLLFLYHPILLYVYKYKRCQKALSWRLVLFAWHCFNIIILFCCGNATGFMLVGICMLHCASLLPLFAHLFDVRRLVV